MHPKLTLFVVLVINFAFCCSQFKKQKRQHQLQGLSKDQISLLAGLTDEDYTNELLDNILTTRVPGTKEHTKVYNYIKGKLEEGGFTVDEDIFEDTTPTHGVLKFKNIIGYMNPEADRFLALVCHYDSKYFENEYFVAAMDSAVPCAMMLNLIKTMQSELDKVKDEKLSLMLLFLDGEEAFLEWTDTDSTYGARNLAAKWANTHTRIGGEKVSMLDRIDAFVLLDLLGHPNPSFFNYFKNTAKLHEALSKIEDTLDSLGEFKNHNKKYFVRERRFSSIQDDHIPFMARGVPIVHVIATPFPSVWHTPDDDREHLDMDTVENLNKIFRCFVAEYLHIPLDNDEGRGKMDSNNQFHEEF